MTRTKKLRDLSPHIVSQGELPDPTVLAEVNLLLDVLVGRARMGEA